MAVIPISIQLLKLKKRAGLSTGISILAEYNLRQARPYVIGKKHGEDVSTLLDGLRPSLRNKLGLEKPEHARVAVAYGEFEDMPDFQGAFVLGNTNRIDLPHLMYFSFYDKHPGVLRPNQEYFGEERESGFKETHQTALYHRDFLLLPQMVSGERLAFRVGLPGQRSF